MSGVPDVFCDQALTLEQLQKRVEIWLHGTLGTKSAMSTRERARRILEEAVELAQAEGVTLEQANRITSVVYARPVGEPHQEAAGVLLCTAAWAAARGRASGYGLHLLSLAQAELERIEQPEVCARIREKNVAKQQAGVSFTLTEGG